MTTPTSPTSNRRSDTVATPAGMEWDAAEYADRDGLESDEQGLTYFADSRSDAWHQLGQQFGRAMTAEELMRESRLGGWDVRKSPLQTVTEDGVFEVPDRFAVVRTNPSTGKAEPLPGVAVGQQYHAIQNEDSCAFLNALVDESGAIFETAGSLNRGRRVFITIKMPTTMRIGGEDPVDLYIAWLNSHDGTSRALGIVTPVRVVCQNTEKAAIKGAVSQFAVTHTKSAGDSLVAKARAALGLTFAFAEAFEAEAQAMIAASMTKRQFDRRVTMLFPKPDKDATKRVSGAWTRRMDTLSDLWKHTAESEGAGFTAWGAYNAVTAFADHVQNVQTRGTFASVADARAARTIEGRNDEIKLAAWANFTEFAHA